MANEEAIAAGRTMVKQIVGEIAAMEYAGDVVAIAAVVIDADGDCRVLTAFGEGTKLPIIAGTVVMQRQLFDHMVVIQKAPKV
jgi:hypothetical protein